jgi:hypothetical protein
MATIRVFEPGDAAEVAALFEEIYPESRWSSRAALAGYIQEMFCGNPWRDPEIPSWVADQDGRLAGFLGVMPRPMMLGKQAIRAAVGCQFLVRPDQRRGLAAIQLLQKYLRGPQDVSVADGANPASARLWEAMGGFVSPLHRLAWIRVFRPAQSALRLVGTRRRWLRPVTALARPLAALADTCVTRAAPFRFNPQLREEALDARALHAALVEHAPQFALQPQYDAKSLEWLLSQLAAKTRHGPLQARMVRDPDGKVAGWFLYYLDRGMSRVMQLAARPDRTRPVLEHLFQHASKRGALALEGRMDPRFVSDLREMQCFFQGCGELTLLHAREPSVLMPLLRGDAFFSRLEGEWWLRFHGEAAVAAPGNPAGQIVSPPLTSMTAPLM